MKNLLLLLILLSLLLLILSENDDNYNIGSDNDVDTLIKNDAINNDTTLSLDEVKNDTNDSNEYINVNDNANDIKEIEPINENINTIENHDNLMKNSNVNDIVPSINDIDEEYVNKQNTINDNIENICPPIPECNIDCEQETAYLTVLSQENEKLELDMNSKISIYEKEINDLKASLALLNTTTNPEDNNTSANTNNEFIPVLTQWNITNSKTLSGILLKYSTLLEANQTNSKINNDDNNDNDYNNSNEISSSKTISHVSISSLIRPSALTTLSECQDTYTHVLKDYTITHDNLKKAQDNVNSSLRKLKLAKNEQNRAELALEHCKLEAEVDASYSIESIELMKSKESKLLEDIEMLKAENKILLEKLATIKDCESVIEVKGVPVLSTASTNINKNDKKVKIESDVNNEKEPIIKEENIQNESSISKSQSSPSTDKSYVIDKGSSTTDKSTVIDKSTIIEKSYVIDKGSSTTDKSTVIDKSIIAEKSYVIDKGSSTTDKSSINDVAFKIIAFLQLLVNTIQKGFNFLWVYYFDTLVPYYNNVIKPNVIEWYEETVYPWYMVNINPYYTENLHDYVTQVHTALSEFYVKYLQDFLYDYILPALDFLWMKLNLVLYYIASYYEDEDLYRRFQSVFSIVVTKLSTWFQIIVTNYMLGNDMIIQFIKEQPYLQQLIGKDLHVIAPYFLYAIQIILAFIFKFYILGILASILLVVLAPLWLTLFILAKILNIIFYPFRYIRKLLKKKSKKASKTNDKKKNTKSTKQVIGQSNDVSKSFNNGQSNSIPIGPFTSSSSLPDKDVSLQQIPLNPSDAMNILRESKFNTIDDDIDMI